jgi:hypothetical protein
VLRASVSDEAGTPSGADVPLGLMMTTLVAAPVAANAKTQMIAAITRRRPFSPVALLSDCLAARSRAASDPSNRGVRFDRLRLRGWRCRRPPVEEGRAKPDACLLLRLISIRPPVMDSP